MQTRSSVYAIATIIVMLAAGCSGGVKPTPFIPTPVPPAAPTAAPVAAPTGAPTGAPAAATPEGLASMTNPASTHCVEQGGKLEIRKNAQGEYGVCVFADKSECEEWAFMRNECQPGGKTAAVEPQLVEFGPGGTSLAVKGSTPANTYKRYALKIMAGQTLTAKLTFASGRAILAIWGAEGTVLISDHAGATEWSGKAPITQYYFIDVRNDQAAQADYTLQLTVPPLPAPTAVPPQPINKRIVFAAGQTAVTEHGSVAAGNHAHYLINVMAGQQLIVNVAAGAGNAGQPALVIFGADGTVLLSDHAGATSWNGKVPSKQDYTIDVKNVGGGTLVFTLQVTVPPLPAPTAAPVQRHNVSGTWGAGSHTLTLQEAFGCGGPSCAVTGNYSEWTGGTPKTATVHGTVNVNTGAVSLTIVQEMPGAPAMSFNGTLNASSSSLSGNLSGVGALTFVKQ